jgi:hypothetical protein
MRRYHSRFLGRTAWKHLPNRFRHSHGERLILFIAIHLRSFTMCAALISVGQAFLLGLLNSRFLDQYALSFVSLTCPAEANDYRGERTVLARPPRQGRVASLQIYQVVEIGTGQAKRSFAFH